MIYFLLKNGYRITIVSRTTNNIDFIENVLRFLVRWIVCDVYISGPSKIKEVEA